LTSLKTKQKTHWIFKCHFKSHTSDIQPCLQMSTSIRYVNYNYFSLPSLSTKAKRWEICDKLCHDLSCIFLMQMLSVGDYGISSVLLTHRCVIIL